MRRTTAFAATLATTATALMVAISAPTAAYAAPSCTTGLTTYNSKFSRSFDLRLLSTHVPQGITYLSSPGVHLTSHYKPDGSSARINAQLADGTDKGEFDMPYTHAGGLAVAGNYLHVAGEGHISSFRLERVRTAFATSGVPFLTSDVYTPINGSSFLFGAGDRLWAGDFTSGTTPQLMFEYRVEVDGRITLLGQYAVPPKTQGVVVTSDRFIFSTSYGRANPSRIYVVKRGYSSWPNAVGKCFEAPSMTQGMSLVSGVVYLNYESGAAYYQNGVVNPQRYAVKANLSSLTP